MSTINYNNRYEREIIEGFDGPCCMDKRWPDIQWSFLFAGSV